MLAKWVFRKLTPGERDRQPTVGEFFATDAISSLAAALVRESIQNSLDAAADKTAPVKVRFHLGEVSWEIADRYLKEAWPHFSANDTGITDLPQEKDVCRYLAVEDFNTTGLTGDIYQWDIPEKDSKNAFYYFYRAEGRSGKGEQDRGRWGIGKYVFPRVSKVKSFVGLTVRHDDKKRLLMGQSILKSHKVSGVTYTPDASYGQEHDVDGCKMVVPISDKASIDEFCMTFALKRTEEAGLSIVVPWVDEVTTEILLKSVLEDYFYPILDGKLVVTISANGENIVVDAGTLFEVTKKTDPEFQKKRMPILKLADWARQQRADDYIELLPSPNARPQLVPEMLNEDARKRIHDALAEGKSIAIKVPVTVREKNKPDESSHFDIFISPAEGEEHRPVFIREDIIIADVRGKSARDVSSIVVIHDSPLAKLLGDSENPAHTQWQRDRDGFKAKYTHASAYLELVANSVATLMKLVYAADLKPDRDLLKEFFYLETEEDRPKKTEDSSVEKEEDGDTTGAPVIKVPAKPSLFSLERIDRGFTVKNNAEGPAEKHFEVRVGYDRSSGSPLKRWTKDDFEVDKGPIRVQHSLIGVHKKSVSGNQLSFLLTNPKAWIRVTGFDANRDLYIDAKVVEEQS